MNHSYYMHNHDIYKSLGFHQIPAQFDLQIHEEKIACNSKQAENKYS